MVEKESVVKELRKLATNWAKTGDFKLSVSEAQLLGCCRICKEPVLDRMDGQFNPLVLNFGTEYAHQKCLKFETTIREQVEKFCENCSHKLPHGGSSVIEEDGQLLCRFCHQIKSLGFEIAKLENDIEYISECRDKDVVEYTR